MAVTWLVHATCSALPIRPGPVARELVGHPARARAALQRPHQRLGPQRSDRRVVEAEMAQPLADDGQVLGLAERIEADPQAEALGQRDLLLDRLARVQLAVLVVRGGQVVLHLLGQQVAPVGRRVHKHVVRRRRDRAVQHRLQRLVAGLALVEAQVVAVDDEALGPAFDQRDDVGQVDEIGLVHLDQAQALRRELVQAGLDQRTLAGAARAGQQHVVGGAAGDELRGVGAQALLLRVHFLQVGQRDRRDVAHRFQHAHPRARAEGARRALAVAERDGRRPVGLGGGSGQQALDAGEEAVGRGGAAACPASSWRELSGWSWREL